MELGLESPSESRWILEEFSLGLSAPAAGSAPVLVLHGVVMWQMLFPSICRPVAGSVKPAVLPSLPLFKKKSGIWLEKE